ncbi:uncharacterized mitochondrial protein AtMg00240-like [Prosopis cineraria]|uniref:uncharacterized mitochondrial protein AtMg00240-like n=1 Tax=Prosopis cineraria TaxID=364024 RepID=UPI00240EA9D1|nr:uncharacterized mitochondrial protein AtMg00240-like [Prosopis cineraria]
MLGKLQYLTVTHLDIVYAINLLSQFVAAPRRTHMVAVERVLRFLKCTPGQGILLTAKGPMKLEAYCDADWAGCLDTRQSCTGYLIKVGGSPVSWKSKKQSMVARSSVDAEYRAMATTVSEVIWL